MELQGTDDAKCMELQVVDDAKCVELQVVDDAKCVVLQVEDLTRFNKIAIQGTPQMAAYRESTHF